MEICINATSLNFKGKRRTHTTVVYFMKFAQQYHLQPYFYTVFFHSLFLIVVGERRLSKFWPTEPKPRMNQRSTFKKSMVAFLLHIKRWRNRSVLYQKKQAKWQEQLKASMLAFHLHFLSEGIRAQHRIPHRLRTSNNSNKKPRKEKKNAINT